MRRILYYFASLFTSAIFMIWSLWQSWSICSLCYLTQNDFSDKCILLQREFIWRHLRYGTTAKAWDDNVKVDWKRRHKDSFYPPQAAECRTRECKAGIDLGTEKTETGGKECNGITGWKPDWGGTEEQMEAEWEKMGNWRLRMRHDLNQDHAQSTNNTNKTRRLFYLTLNCFN